MSIFIRNLFIADLFGNLQQQGGWSPVQIQMTLRNFSFNNCTLPKTIYSTIIVSALLTPLLGTSYKTFSHIIYTFRQ